MGAAASQMIRTVMLKRILYVVGLVLVGNVFIIDIFDILDLEDVCRCDALTSDGYSDNITGQWTPNSCLLHHYTRR